MINLSDREAAEALVACIGDARWEAVTLALAYLAVQEGQDLEQVARMMYERGPYTLKRNREIVKEIGAGFLHLITPRKRTGSAENPITKLFPATITEQRFVESLEDLCLEAVGLSYSDERESGHSLVDFSLEQAGLSLPINVKNAGTRFRRAQNLVGLSPDDCIPIPAYKAYGALDAVPNLIYAVSVDYALVTRLENLLPSLLSPQEMIVWKLLSDSSGARIRSAEDAFVFSTTRKYWSQLSSIASNSPFHVISARKAVRILQTKPQRTPGIGLRAWGTGASAEVNVHISISEETTPWETVYERIRSNGISDIISAVNRRRFEEVYDPEI